MWEIINEEHKPEEVFSVGFGSYKGTIAGREGGCYAGYEDSSKAQLGI
jgi:hypothetical protein